MNTAIIAEQASSVNGLIPFHSEVLKALQTKEPIFLVRSLLEANELRQLGLTATHSFSNTWTLTSKERSVLTEGQIVLVPANDPQAMADAKLVARVLTDEEKANVRIVDLARPPAGLPVPEGEDVACFIAAGATKEDFSRFSRMGCERSANNVWEPTVLPWPKLNPIAMPGIIGEFVDLATRNSEADPAAVLSTFLVRYGVEVGTGPHLMVGDSRHPARLFAVICGNTSKSRKGTSAKPVERLFSLFSLNSQGKEKSAFETEYEPAASSPGPLSSGEGLIFRVRDPVQEWKTHKGKGQWVITDPGIDDKRLFVLDEELAGALHGMKREGNRLSATIRCLWDSGTYEPLTKVTKTKCTNSHICIVAHITQKELKEVLGTIEIFNGLANRFLWVCAKRRKLIPFPEPMPENELSPIGRYIRQSIIIGSRDRRLAFTADAMALWEEYYPTLTKDRTGLSGSVMARGEAQTLRLALIYALIDKTSQVERSHLESALAFWNYVEQSIEYLFGGSIRNPIQERILSALNHGPISKGDIYTIFKGHIKKKELESNLQELVGSGVIDISLQSTQGRPKRLISISKCEKSEKSEESLFL